MPMGGHGIGQDESEYARVAQMILDEPDAFESVGDDVFYWFTLLTPTIGDIERGKLNHYATWVQDVRKLGRGSERERFNFRKASKVNSYVRELFNMIFGIFQDEKAYWRQELYAAKNLLKSGQMPSSSCRNWKKIG